MNPCIKVNQLPIDKIFQFAYIRLIWAPRPPPSSDLVNRIIRCISQNITLLLSFLQFNVIFSDVVADIALNCQSVASEKGRRNGRRENFDWQVRKGIVWTSDFCFQNHPHITLVIWTLPFTGSSRDCNPGNSPFSFAGQMKFRVEIHVQPFVS